MHTNTFIPRYVEGILIFLMSMAFSLDCHAQWEIKKSGKPDFQSNLPVVVIDCRNEINAQEKVPAEMFIDGQYDGAIGIKYRGNSSQSFNQKKYSIETRDDFQSPLDVSLFDMPAEHDWVLMCPYNDVSMMRDALASRLWTDMGHWGPRFQQVEVVFNGEYIGIYGFCETIKQTAGRLGIKTPKNKDPKTQGYVLRIDKYDQDDLFFRSKLSGVGAGFSHEIVWTCRYPKKDKITSEQLDYIHKYVDEAEAALCDKESPKQKAEQYVDLMSFVDYFIHTELSLNADAYKSSSYFYKEPDKADGTKGLLHAGSVWDYNLAYGCCTFCNADDINAWAFDGCETSATPAFWRQFATDKDLFSMVCTRYKELRSGALSNKHIMQLVDGYASQLRQSQQRHFEKYPELLTEKGSEKKTQNQQSFGMFGMFSFGTGDFDMAGGMLDWFRSYTVSSYEEEIKYLKTWLGQRLEVMDKRFMK